MLNRLSNFFCWFEKQQLDIFLTRKVSKVSNRDFSNRFINFSGEKTTQKITKSRMKKIESYFEIRKKKLEKCQILENPIKATFILGLFDFGATAPKPNIVERAFLTTITITYSSMVTCIIWTFNHQDTQRAHRIISDPYQLICTHSLHRSN